MTTTERFWSKVDRTGDCWTWTGTRKEGGYGQFHYGGKTTKAHRVAWILTSGAIPDGMCVLHHCDNPPCVRPEHLFLGTLSDNMQDCAAKGRCALQRDFPRTGLDNPRGKLTDFDVAVIRALRPLRDSRELAPIFGVTDSHIRLLWRGAQRAHVAPAPMHVALHHLTERKSA